MAIADDFSISASGDIRYTGSGTNYTVIALHRWLGDLMDDAQASGNDILDITDATASERSTDNIIKLKYPYNIDWVAAQHLYDGSIIQSRTSGNLEEDIWDGILVFAAAGTYLQVIQNGLPVSPNFWTTALNADATAGISHRFMLKVRDNGTDIDGRRLLGQTREFGYTYSQFPVNGTSRGNNVFALTYAGDLNNQTVAATVKGWTTITNTEGYRSIDVDGNSTPEHYYSEWNKAAYTINQFYERIKWLTRRSTIEDSNADTGTDYALNNTNTGFSQSFANGVVAQFLTRVRFKLKKTGSPTGNLVAKLYNHTGVYGTSSVPDGAAIATSDNFDVSKLTTAYQEFEIGFTTQYEMLASTNYCIAVEYTSGDGSNYVSVDGDATGTHGGNLATYAGSWSATAGADLWFQCFASPKLYGVAGERVRGITHEVALTTPRTGDFNATELVSWGSGATAGTGIMFAIDSETVGTKMWIQLLTGVAPSSSVTITGLSSSATATNSGTPTERSLSFPLCGASTGSAIIGSYGFGIESADLLSTDKLFALEDPNTPVTPPNNVTFYVYGVMSGHDRVLVGPASGGVLDEDQFTLDTALTGATETSVNVSSSIPTDTPSSGTIRVKLNSGIFKRVTYNSYTGDVFTIPETDFSGDNASIGNNVFISYIDAEATGGAPGDIVTVEFTGVFLASRDLFIRVRDGGASPIKTFETTGTLSSSGGSATAIRTPDV